MASAIEHLSLSNRYCRARVMAITRGDGWWAMVVGGVVVMAIVVLGKVPEGEGGGKDIGKNYTMS